MGKYDAVAGRALATIKRKGSTAVFRSGTGDGTEGDIYDPLTGLWTTIGGTAATTATLPTVQIPGDPERYALNNMTMVDSLSLLVAPVKGAITPEVGQRVTWADKEYTVKYDEATAPDGTPLMYAVDAQG